MAPRTAFLEFGSTSIKFYLVTATGPDAGKVEVETKIPWDLGYDVFEHARISPTTIARGTATLRELQAEYPDVSFESATAVGTAALREAQNADVFQRVIGEELGLQIHVIEGGIEAFLLETGFRSTVTQYPTGLFDLGGGSLELVEYLSAYATKKTSLPLGAIRLHCQLRSTKDLFAYVTEARRHVAAVVEHHLVGQTPPYRELIGTGGTMRTLIRLVGSEALDGENIRALVDREIRGEPWEEVEPHRRRVLLPGALIVEGLLATLKLDRVVYRGASVKRGLINLTRLLPGGGVRPAG